MCYSSEHTSNRERKAALQKVTLIGAANIDIQGFPFEELIYRDSNPGEIRICPGGVSRNIAENLSRMGVSTELIAAVGKGVNGEYILDSCRKSGIGTGNILIVPEMESSTYLAIMDNSGDMALALSDMSISDRITVDYIRLKRDQINESSIIEIDPCLSEEVIAFIINEFSHIPIFIDPVSIGKAEKLKNVLGGINTLKLNRLEAGYLSGMEVKEEQDLNRISEWFLNTGIQNLFVTLGKDGVFYNDGSRKGMIVPPEIDIASATGAGDAFMAGVIYGALEGYNIEKSAEFATAASLIALGSQDTVNPGISAEGIKIIIKEKFNK